MKSHGLFVNYIPVNFLFPFIKELSSLAVGELACGLPWLQILNCNSLLIPNKDLHLCWRNIWQSIYFRLILLLTSMSFNIKKK